MRINTILNWISFFSCVSKKGKKERKQCCHLNYVVVGVAYLCFSWVSQKKRKKATLVFQLCCGWNCFLFLSQKREQDASVARKNAMIWFKVLQKKSKLSKFWSKLDIYSSHLHLFGNLWWTVESAWWCEWLRKILVLMDFNGFNKWKEDNYLWRAILLTYY